MRTLFVILIAGLLSGCATIDSFTAFLGPNAAQQVRDATDKATDETAERYEDLCDLVPQNDIDFFFAEVNRSMDLRADGTKPIVGTVECNL